MHRRLGVFAVCTLTLLSQSIEKPNATRTVQITGMRVSPDHLPKGSSKCALVSVTVDTNTTTLADGPRIVLSMVKSSSMPPEISIDPPEQAIDATLSGPAIFNFDLCPARGTWAIVGKIKAGAAILGVGPDGKFKFDRGGTVAELTIDP